MAKKNKIGENFCTHKPQFGLEHTPFLNGHHSPADRARELFKSALNGGKTCSLGWKKNFSLCNFGLSGYVYKTTGCFDML